MLGEALVVALAADDPLRATWFRSFCYRRTSGQWLVALLPFYALCALIVAAVGGGC